MAEFDAFFDAGAVAAPVVEKRPAEVIQHGKVRIDPYQWLRADNWQEVLRKPDSLPEDIRGVLQQENDYYKAVTKDLEPLRKALFKEMRGRMKENESSVPFPDGPFQYWQEYRQGGEYPIYKRSSRDGSEEMTILDGDAEKGESAFFEIGSIDHSPDHRYAAYTVDRVGSEYFTIQIREMESGKDLPDRIDNADESGVVWAADSTLFYYVERDDHQRPKRVKRHILGEPSSKDVVLYEEPRDDMFLGLSRSQSGEWIFITTSNSNSSEVRYLPTKGREEPRLVSPRKEGLEYYLEHHGESFLVRTNADGAVNFKLMRAPIETPGRGHWQEFIPHRDDVYFVYFIPFKDYLAVMERENALPRITIHRFDGEQPHSVSFEEAAYSLSMSGGYEYETPALRIYYDSPSTPDETITYDMQTRLRDLLKRREVPSGHDKSRYVVERFFASARDGAQIPVTLLRLRETPRDGSAKVLLYGYGSYGATIPASFSTNILSLVDRGVIYAIAHPRGGAALGRQWYLDGKLDKKMNTFTDFNAVAEHLIEHDYTQKRRIVIFGGSAGGLLVGAAVNLRPDLYGGVLAAVPFVDVLNTISDGSLPLTPPEWEEWGNPIENPEHFGWISAYSPYENIKSEHYPPIMATGGLTDYRVTYWEMSKWTARLRDEAAGGPFLLRMNMDAGHAGSAARFERLDEYAHLYAFALKALGMADAEPIIHE